MSKSLSSYLNLLRFSAALLVFFDHYSLKTISGGLLWQLQVYGHSAVIVFFVLSGFVIAFAAEKNETNFRDYIVARLARLLSVTLPAILLTVICDALGNIAAPDLYTGDPDYSSDHPLLRIVTAATFTSQIWFARIKIFSNLSYWSLPYEFWYYIAFAGLVYFVGWRRFVWCIGVACVAGPKILILFPVWLLGTACWRYRHCVSKHFAPWLFVGSIGLTIFLIAAGGEGLFYHPEGEIWPEKFSLYDYLLGGLVGVNLLGAAGMTSIPFVLRGAKLFGALASFTFSLYLFHLPLLQMIRALLPGSPSDFLSRAVVGIGAFVIVFILGRYTEHRKYLMKRWILCAAGRLHTATKRTV